jgi:serralysin
LFGQENIMANVSGTPSDDILYGTNDPDVITGDTGNDRLFAFAGDDTLDGGDGSDLLDGGTGADTMSGGTGNDYYYVDNVGDRVIENASAGIDLVFTTIDYTLPDNVERLAPLDQHSTNPLTLIGNTLGNEIIGNDGANLIVGGGGSNFLRGGGGDDTYVVTSMGDTVAELSNEGNDSILYAGTTSNSLHYDFDYSLLRTELNVPVPPSNQVTSIEHLGVYDQTTTNSVNFRGSIVDDLLTGNEGINVFEGHSGNDTMIGYGGDDYYYVGEAGDTVIEQAGGGYDTVFLGRYYPHSRNAADPTITSYTLADDVERVATDHVQTTPYSITGNALDNEISGNDSNNVLNGGDGNDILIGYEGLDTWVFTSAPGEANADQIPDFGAGYGEKMELDHNQFTGMALGTVSDSQFQRGTVNWQALDADDRILYDMSTGHVYFDPDGSGAQAPELFVTIHEGLNLTASDFIVV